ncbi:S-layer homology domain-containing protein [Paenibacillus doosanensis]|uniref:Endo-1,4-beta-xylanase A n=1 Tax=Paenibacillus konkukensis TaxID=2020716 RepID=A0ABY4RLC3_9BACL|nr:MULTISPECIES: S-layer homology domain-containing protein [Paenibacillus]MCS7460694.1 S-layer homology domain-containing protein [Paenibacillus doosanensis]UQZ82676.1 Endo-1,4-beta-xylanase A precursor [Paenibacillus konkukensis]
MRFPRIITCGLVVALLVIAAAPAMPAAAADEPSPSFTLTLSTDKPSKGENVEVIVKGHELKDVYAYEVNLNFDPTALRLKGATTELPGFSVSPIVTDNHIQLAHTRIGRVMGDDGDQVLYTLTFEALQGGTTELAIDHVKLLDSILTSTDHASESKVALAIDSLFPFDDLGDYGWAKEAIAYLFDKGIVNGTSEHTFSPGQPVTRADYLVLLMRLLKVRENAGERFDDVPQGVYYEGLLGAARSLGIAEGDEYNNFHPGAPVTREDMIVLTDRALRAANKLSVSLDASVLQGYADVSDISDYAVGSVSTLVGSGVVEGYNQGIYPKETTNRAQAAMLIYKLLISKNIRIEE